MTTERFTHPIFRAEVQRLLPIRGHAQVAAILYALGVSFEDAYVAIFKKQSRPISEMVLDFTV